MWEILRFGLWRRSRFERRAFEVMHFEESDSFDEEDDDPTTATPTFSIARASVDAARAVKTPNC